MPEHRQPKPNQARAGNLFFGEGQGQAISQAQADHAPPDREHRVEVVPRNPLEKCGLPSNVSMIVLISGKNTAPSSMAAISGYLAAVQRRNGRSQSSPSVQAIP